MVHCDIKPENIMFYANNYNCIKVIDYGSSCLATERVYTYIQSRFYRAPEIMLGVPYTEAIDMWSYGCLLIEMYTGFPLFPADSEVDLFSRIVEVIGLPPDQLLTLSARKKQFYRAGEPIMVRNKRGQKRVPGGRPIESCIHCSNKHFIGLVKECLQWDPASRISPTDAKNHPFFTIGRRLKRRKTKSVKVFKSFS